MLNPEHPGASAARHSPDLTAQDWAEVEQWWLTMAARLGVPERGQTFFDNARGPAGALQRAHRVGGDVHYILFVLLRYWIPAVLPPSGRERVTKGDQDYWLESEHILKAAAARLRELKPLIELLTAPNPVPSGPGFDADATSPVVEVELSNMLDGIAEVAGSYGGPDYTSVVKNFDPVPLRQTQPFKHNKKNSAELWVVFLLREHFRSLGVGKDRYWPVIADLVVAAGMYQPTGSAYAADEVKSWWQKNWPRTYTQLEQKQATVEPGGAAYPQDFQWFRAWFEWQLSRTS